MREQLERRFFMLMLVSVSLLFGFVLQPFWGAVWTAPPPPPPGPPPLALPPAPPPPTASIVIRDVPIGATAV